MRSGRRLIILLASLLGLAGVLALVTVLTEEKAEKPLPRASAPRAVREPAPAATAAPRARPAAAPAVPAAVRAQAARLSRAEQVAQLFLVGFEGTDASAFPALRSRGWGGLLMTADNVLSPDQGALLLGEAAVQWRIRPLVATTEVPGFELPVQSPDDRPAAVRRTTRAAAAALRAAGVSLALAPDADVGFEAAEGAYGDDPERVAALVEAAVRGLRAGGMIPAPGRFPGEGAANQDPLEGPAIVGLSREELAARDLIPFRRVAGRVPAMVVSSAAFSAYDPVTPASLTPAIVKDLLRGELGFQGVAMSAELAGVTASTGGTVADAAVEALRAGIDMVQISEPADAEAAYRAVLRARIPPERLREALLRVLALKRAAGLAG